MLLSTLVVLAQLRAAATFARVRNDEVAGFDPDLAAQGLFRPGVGAGGVRKRNDAARRRESSGARCREDAAPRSYLDPEVSVDFDVFFDSATLARDGRLGIILRRRRDCESGGEGLCAYDLHAGSFDREDGQMLAAELSDITLGDAIIAIDGVSLRDLSFSDAYTRLAEAVQWRKEMVADAKREAAAEAADAPPPPRAPVPPLVMRVRPGDGRRRKRKTLRHFDYTVSFGPEELQWLRLSDELVVMDVSELQAQLDAVGSAGERRRYVRSARPPPAASLRRSALPLRWSSRRVCTCRAPAHPSSLRGRLPPSAQPTQPPQVRAAPGRNDGPLRCPHGECFKTTVPLHFMRILLTI